MSLFPKPLVDEIGPFDPELAVAEDWDFWLRAIYAGHRVALQPRPLALYRWGDGRACRPRRARMDEHVEAVLRTAAERDDLTAEERAYLERRLSGPGPAALGRSGDEALRATAATARRRASYRDAAALCPSEPRARSGRRACCASRRG